MTGRASQIFVIDPACVEAFGHNVEAVRSFGTILSDIGPVRMLGCRYLDDGAKGVGIEPFFDWYYPNIFSTRQFLAAASTCSNGSFEEAATVDFREFLSRFTVGATDAVVLPSADIYGVLGLLNALLDRPVSKSPRVLLRFLNVMEHAAPMLRNPLETMLTRVRCAIAQGLPVAVSAETVGYSRVLEQALGTEVPVTPYPIYERPTASPRFGPFVVGALGLGRSDKGFYNMFQIIADVNRTMEGEAIRFLVQGPGVSEALDNLDYLCQLYALPNVRLLNGYVSPGEWEAHFAACHCFILPYDASVYANRGSAISARASHHGKPVLTLQGVGFEPELSFYGLGVAVRSLGDFASAILALARTPQLQLDEQMRRAKLRMERDARDAYCRWLRAVGLNMPINLYRGN